MPPALAATNTFLGQIKYHRIRGNEENAMVLFVTGKKCGKANSEGDFCIHRFVTCYMSHCYEVDADLHSPLDSVSDSTKIIFFQAKLTENILCIFDKE